MRRWTVSSGLLAAGSDWVERYRKFWEGSFQRLDLLLEELKANEKKARKRKGDRR